MRYRGEIHPARPGEFKGQLVLDCGRRDASQWNAYQPYEQGNIFNKDPMRVRRLLMHKREIMRLFGLVKQDGYSLIPVSLYFKGSRVKVQVGLCKGKKLYDKRSDLAARAAKRDIQRAMKERNR